MSLARLAPSEIYRWQPASAGFELHQVFRAEGFGVESCVLGFIKGCQLTFSRSGKPLLVYVSRASSTSRCERAVFRGLKVD